MLTAITLGFVLGLRHAADPDHVAAIAAIVARDAVAGGGGRSARRAAGVGALWGAGHSLVILAVGGLLVALHVAVVPAWALAAEAAVAAILVALGITNLRRMRSDAPPGEGPPAGGGALRWRSLGVGMAHGLAGSAAVALLALATMPSMGAAFAYLLLFGIGTITGMMAMSFGLGLPAATLASGRAGLARWLLGGSGCASIAVGLALLLEVGRTLQAAS